MNRKILIGILAGIITAALTLAAVIGLVRGTIWLLTIASAPLRILAIAADLIFGSLLLIGCIYLATRWAVRIFGVGSSALSPVPESIILEKDSRV